MKIYYKENTNSKSSKNFIICITTYQSPHLEAMLNYIEINSSKYKNIYILNFTEILNYRHDLSWREYLPFRVNISRKIRNSFLKNYFFF